jgi:DNA polymerase III delta subunit
MSYAAFQKTVLPELERRKGDLTGSSNHPFVIYNAFVHSDNYTFDELAQALEVLLDADMRLKTTGQDARLVLAHAILNICGNPAKASENCGG